MVVFCATKFREELPLRRISLDILPPQMPPNRLSPNRLSPNRRIGPMTPMRAFWTLGLIFLIRGLLSIGLFAQEVAQESHEKSDPAVVSLLAGRCLDVL
jgi:hypothetical protein